MLVRPEGVFTWSNAVTGTWSQMQANSYQMQANAHQSWQMLVNVVLGPIPKALGHLRANVSKCRENACK